MTSTTFSLRSAQSLAEFVAIVDDIRPQTSAGLWFRGQSRAERQLIPSVYRQVETITDGRGNPVKPGQIVRSSGGEVGGPSPELALAAYKRLARPFLPSQPENDFEWMFVGQHHGLKTRLLDWSTNALAGLFFGASTARISGGDGAEACRAFEEGDAHRDDGFAVFVIDPGAMNEAAHSCSYPIDIAAEPEKWAHYLNPVDYGLSAYLPICVVAPHVSPRIRAQSGVFTLHGSNIQAIDYYDVLRPMITKIFLPYTATESIRASLRTLGVTSSFIYPGLETIAADVNDSEARRYAAERKLYLASIQE